MPAVTFLVAAATNGGYAAQFIIFVLGVLLGMLLLGLGELSILGFLKLRELRQIWVTPRPAPEPDDDFLPDPESPAESRKLAVPRPHLRVVAPPRPATATLPTPRPRYAAMPAMAVTTSAHKFKPTVKPYLSG